jgi:hypothetical protein
VLAAQSDAGTAPTPTLPEAKKSPKNLILAVAGVVLILVGGAGVYAAYRFVASHMNVAALPSVPSLVFADDRLAIEGEGSALMQALASAGDGLEEGQVRVVYVTQASTTPDGKVVTVPVAGGRLIGSLQLSAPDILLRNIGNDSTVGLVHAGSESRAFFILRALSYERTFAGMLQWEGRIRSDLAILYPDYALPSGPAPVVATTTRIVNGKTVISTTTVAAAPVVLAAPRFVDEIAANHDVRALKDGAGRTLLLYGYKDKDLLIIARDEAAFTELVNRLSATKQQ